MNFEELFLKADDGYSLCIRVYDTKNPKAVIKITHGMEEHQARYQDFAEFLVQNGYAVITADLRGHGKNAPKLSHIANKNGHKLLVQDEKVIINYIKNRYPNINIILFAHSMGTIIARKLLQTESTAFEKVILSGYPNPQPVGTIGAILTSIIGAFKGKEGHSKMLTKMVFKKFVTSVKDFETIFDWISYNKDNIIKYMKDDLCGNDFTIGSYNALFHLVGDINNPKMYKNVKSDLPILLISGKDDPCTNGEKGRKASLEKLEKAGFENIQVKTIDGMRHEILNEKENQKVYNDILKFIEQ